MQRSPEEAAARRAGDVVAPGAAADDMLALVRARAQELLRQGQFAEAEAGFAAVLTRTPDDAVALAGLARARMHQGHAAQAQAMLAEAVARLPGTYLALAPLGPALLELEDFAAALKVFDRLVALAPAEIEAQVQRGAALAGLARHNEALTAFETALMREPAHEGASKGRADMLAALGRDQEALAAYTQLLRLAPQEIDGRAAQARLLKRMGLNDAALESFTRLTALRPDDAGLQAERGAVLQALGRDEEALAAFDAALARDPEHPQALAARAAALADLGSANEALAIYDRLCEAQPDNADLAVLRAGVLLALGRHDAALAATSAILERAPDHLAALLVRGQAHRHLGHPEPAIDALRRVLAGDPANKRAFAALGELYLSTGDWPALDRYRAEIDVRVGQGTALLAPEVILALVPDAETQRDWLEHFVQETVPAVTPLDRPWSARRRRLRIAYVAADFAALAQRAALIDLIARHDRARFDILGVAYAAAATPAEEMQLEQVFDEIHLLPGASAYTIARLLRDLDVAIAVDLVGHGAGGRPMLWAYRGAALQVAFPGFPATSGSDFFDYLLADAVAIPPAIEACFTEQIVRLPGSFVPRDPNAAMAAPPPRADLGLPEQNCVFAALGPPAMLDEIMFDALVRIIKGVKDSVLWLPAATDAAGRRLQERLTAAAGSRGLDAGRLRFAAVPDDEAVRRAHLTCADLVLDANPVGDARLVADALQAGVPVLTCMGGTLASRVGASLMAAHGLSELIAADLGHYEALAGQLARNETRRAAIRATLAERRARAAMFEVESHRRHVEAAYLTMWDIHTSGAPKRGFSVPAD